MPVQLLLTPTARQDGDVYIVIRDGVPANVEAHGDGLNVLSGTVAPTTEGVNGEFYINTTTHYLYGPKAAGVWPAGVSLVGPAGAFTGDSDDITEGVVNLFYTDERARDAIGTALTAGTGITVTPNDGSDIITIATTITQYTDEMARDALGTAITAGTGITVTPNDGADTITVATTITQYTDEMARDALGTALTAGTGITITPNDGADTITVASSITQYTDALARTAITGTPAGLPWEMLIACGDETTSMTTGTKATFRMPRAVTLASVRGSLVTAATGATLFAFDVKESGTTIFSTKPTFDASEKTTTTAATPSVLSDTSLADDAEMTIIVDAVGNTIAGAGLKVLLKGTIT